jgi:hypothetical protein
MPRTTPLRADPAPVDHDEPADPSRLRSVLLGMAVGFAVTVAGIAIAFSIVAIPLFIVASTEPEHGLDRDLVKRGLFEFAIPFGLVAGIGAGIAVGVWFGRGGRLPTDRRTFYEE